tara:strand:- start:4082 stop:4528 length:447 start_codon:yes stop_codon:yes gene_type:complete
MQQYQYMKQAWGFRVELPFLLFLNKLVRFFISKPDEFVFKKVLKNLQKGKQPKLIVLTCRFDGCNRRGARITSLKLENLNFGVRRYCFYCGMLIEYSDLVRYLNYNGWRPICFNDKLIEQYEIQFKYYKMKDIKPFHIVFVPRGPIWP